jgi:uncharacterized membrane protein YciS (DUF1049 family)
MIASLVIVLVGVNLRSVSFISFKYVVAKWATTYQLSYNLSFFFSRATSYSCVVFVSTSTPFRK